MEMTQKKRQALKKHAFILSVIGVQLACFCVFYVGVNFNSILLSFQNVKANGTTVWTFNNFTLFFENLRHMSELTIALRNTFIFFAFSLFMIPISFTVSYFIYKKIWGYRVFRIVFFFPSILSPVVWSNVYLQVVGVNGFVAAVIQKISGTAHPPMLLGDPRYAIVFVVLYSFWLGIASNFVLYSGTLGRIPESVIEAGKIDGIGWFSEICKVIVPLVWPTLSTIILLSFTGLFVSSGNILLLTNGNYETTTISFLIFQSTWNEGRPALSGTTGYASAVGLVFTALTIPIVWLVNKLLGKVEDVVY